MVIPRAVLRDLKIFLINYEPLPVLINAKKNIKNRHCEFVITRDLAEADQLKDVHSFCLAIPIYAIILSW
jgi:hypothetical protein